MALHATLARICLDRRVRLGLTQRELARRVGVERSYIAKVEHGRANPSLDTAERLIRALGLEVDLLVERTIIIGERRSTDRVHGWCSGFADRRLRAHGWQTAREVEVGGQDGRASGWIDLLAFDPRTRVLLVIEIKTRLDDLGALERRLGWYERHAAAVAVRRGWRPRRIIACVLLLQSEEVEASLRGWADAMRSGFPLDVDDLVAIIDGSGDPHLDGNRAIALVDPARRGGRWLIRPRVAGGRSRSPYRDYRDAAIRMPGRSSARAAQERAADE